LTLQGGLDWRVGSALRLGAYASLSLGAFVNGSWTETAEKKTTVIDADFANKDVHGSLALGLRGTFGFGS